MSRSGIEQVLFLLDQAFDASQHSLLANLATVPEEAWLWVPPGGDRSIFDVVQHVGGAKYMYENHAFGDGSMRRDKPASTPRLTQEQSRDEVVAYLNEGHRRMRGSVEALADDEELLRLRPSNWGKEYETRWLISTMIEHDLYHAGEINHLRSIHQADDLWAFQKRQAATNPAT